MFIELCATLLTLLLMCVVVQTAKRIGKQNRQIYTHTLAVTAFVYLCGVVYFTAIHGQRTGLGGARLRIMLPLLWVFCDRRYIKGAVVHLLNILLLVPFGYLLPQMKRPKWWQVILLGFAFSLMIETSQFIFHFGVFQTDDLIDNTLGAALGYLLFFLLNRKNDD